MDEDKYNAFTSTSCATASSRMYDDVTPTEVVTLVALDLARRHEERSRDELLRLFLEHLVADLKSQLPTWWQIHEAQLTGKNPYECERKVTPRPPGAGMFLGSMGELRADVVRNGLGVIEGGLMRSG